MGGMNVRGTVNGDGEFSISIDHETFDVLGMSLNDTFPELKDECKDK